MPDLFDPLRIRQVRIPNRVVMPPMICFGWSDDTGLATERHVVHYARRAEGGCGLIILEAHCVQKDGRLRATQLGLWSDEQLEGLRRITEACHRHGAVVLVQIHHAGYRTQPEVAVPALAPSDYEDEDGSGREMTSEELRGIQDAFVSAATRAKKAGADGIELHGAHGYLLSQFASPVVNRRRDRYGGDLAKRATFALEIIDRLREETVDDRFLLGYRIGADEPTLKEGSELARILETAGVDLLHVSRGLGGGEEPTASEGFPFHWITYAGTEIARHVTTPVIAVYGIRRPEQARWLVQNGVGFAAVGKGHLVEPDWALKAKSGHEVITCLDCQPSCHWFSDGNKSDCPRYDHELYSAELEKIQSLG